MNPDDFILKPVRDRILVKRLDADDKTQDGLIIPENAKDKPHRGVVLAVGPGIPNEQGVCVPPGVEVGQTVLFSKWTPVEFKENGEEYLVIREDDVLGILPTITNQKESTPNA